MTATAAAGVLGGAAGGNTPLALSTSAVGANDEIKELFTYIGWYRPQDVDLEPELKPFIPDYIPAVGDIDAFVKIPRPDGKSDTLGLTTVDEPGGKQSDPSVLDLQLRALSKTSTAGPMVVHSIDGETMKSDKGATRVDQWLKNIRDLHESKPPPKVNFNRRMPDVEELMQEWPKEIEALLDELQRPSADLNLPLAQYVRLCSVLLDIPVPSPDVNSTIRSRAAAGKKHERGLIESLCLVFTLYAEFKNSQHFTKTGRGWIPSGGENAASTESFVTTRDHFAGIDTQSSRESSQPSIQDI